MMQRFKEFNESTYNKHKIRVKVSKDGGEKHHVDVKVFADSESEAKGKARMRLHKDGYTTHSATHQGYDYDWLKKEHSDICSVCGQTPCNCTHIQEEQLDELSTDLLARYKQKASLASSAADKAGKYDLGHKRFKGILKATFKQFANDAKKHQK